MFNIFILVNLFSTLLFGLVHCGYVRLGWNGVVFYLLSIIVLGVSSATGLFISIGTKYSLPDCARFWSHLFVVHRNNFV